MHITQVMAVSVGLLVFVFERRVYMHKVKLTKYDDCCYRVSIQEDGKEVESGLWCSQTHVVAIEGECVGFCATKEAVIKTLKPIKVTKYKVIDTA